MKMVYLSSDWRGRISRSQFKIDKLRLLKFNTFWTKKAEFYQKLWNRADQKRSNSLNFPVRAVQSYQVNTLIGYFR